MATEDQLRALLAKQFELTNTNTMGEGDLIRNAEGGGFEIVDDEEGVGQRATFYTLTFNTALNVEGDGNFRVTYMEKDDDEPIIVDYEALA